MNDRESMTELCAEVERLVCELEKEVALEREVTRETKDICPVCCEEADVHTMEAWTGKFHSACGCAACLSCIAGWVDKQLPRCRHERQLRCTCLSCPKTLPQKIVLAASAAARSLADALDRRAALQQNVLFPLEAQVDCIVPGCVGLGYLGHDTIMCFVCEEQWSALDQDDIPVGASATWLEAAGFEVGAGDEIVPKGIKRCPACRVLISKAGGCDHMQCVCGHQFWWSTLKAYGAGCRY